MSKPSTLPSVLGAIVKTFRLALPKLGVGWMFALLTIDFNRIAIVELGIMAVLVTSMLALHYFLSPFQVIVGRMADRYPVMGLRRTPYLIAGCVIASVVFVMLPSVIHQVADGVTGATAMGIGLFILFGIAIAMMGDSHHSLIAEVTTDKSRGAVVSVVWTFTILSTIMAAILMNVLRPEYTPEAMQQLYNLTPYIVIGSTLLGIVGIEKRLTKAELEVVVAKAQAVTPEGNPISAAISLLRNNRQTRGFFLFIFVSIFAIFLQDNILEVFGAEVFGMSVKETTRFQPTWGGGVLIGMIAMGIISVFAPISKKSIAVTGCLGTAVGMVILAFAAVTQQESLVQPSLIIMGLFTGFFNVGALSMMMDMTVDGATGIYMGLWGVAQAFGMGFSSIGSGLLHTGLIENGLLGPNLAYCLIFGIEATGMVVAALVLTQLSVKRFRTLHENSLRRVDVLRAMEAGAVA